MHQQYYWKYYAQQYLHHLWITQDVN